MKNYNKNKNNIKYAYLLTQVKFNIINKLNSYIDLSKLNKGYIIPRYKIKNFALLKINKKLNQLNDLENKINNLIYDNQ